MNRTGGPKVKSADRIVNHLRYSLRHLVLNGDRHECPYFKKTDLKVFVPICRRRDSRACPHSSRITEPATPNRCVSGVSPGATMPGQIQVLPPGLRPVGLPRANPASGSAVASPRFPSTLGCPGRVMRSRAEGERVPVPTVRNRWVGPASFGPQMTSLEACRFSSV